VPLFPLLSSLYGLAKSEGQEVCILLGANTSLRTVKPLSEDTWSCYQKASGHAEHTHALLDRETTVSRRASHGKVFQNYNAVSELYWSDWQTPQVTSSSQNKLERRRKRNPKELSPCLP